MHDALFQELCERLGFCLSSEDRSRIADLSVTDVDRFTDLVLTAEGFDPPELCDREVRRQVQAVVEKWLRSRSLGT